MSKNNLKNNKQLDAHPPRPLLLSPDWLTFFSLLDIIPCCKKSEPSPPLVCVAHHPPLNTNHLPRQLLREVPNMKDGPFLSTTGRAPQTDNHSTPSLSLKCPHGPSFPKLNVPKLAGCRFTEASTIRENQSAVVGRSVPMKLVVWWWFCCVGVAASSERRCESVSSSLNAAFQGGARFDASVESVESYMSRSGLLVIMCTTLASWNGSTECDEPMDHLALRVS